MSLANKIIVIGGPTASGKTSLSIRLANELNCPILSADSRQFYKEMNIGTAKPNAKELAQADHYFIGTKSIHDAYTVGDYEKEALELCTELFKKHKTLILVGGSGLFIDALTVGLNKFPFVAEQVKLEVQELYETKGLNYIQEKLKKEDPEYYEIVDLQNPARIMRALTITKTTDKTFSYYRNQKLPIRSFQSNYFALDWDRPKLYNRINDRVDLMMTNGLYEEAEGLYANRKLAALQTVGYQELFKAMEQKISNEDAIELIKRNTRRYAKRQMTWLRRESKYTLLETNNDQTIEKAAQEILKYIG